MMKNLFLILLLIIAVQVKSQNIIGIVRDSVKNTTISNVKVKIKNLSTGVEDSVTTNSNGQWTFNLMTNVEADEFVTDNFIVFQNYPNPFSAEGRFTSFRRLPRKRLLNTTQAKIPNQPFLEFYRHWSTVYCRFAPCV